MEWRTNRRIYHTRCSIFSFKHYQNHTMMPIAKRARVDRAKVVKKEVLFHEAMGLVQVHHSGHLNSFEADRKAVRAAAAEGPCRAHAIVEAIETQHNMYNWVGDTSRWRR